MKYRQIWLAALLCILLVCLAGCGGTAETDQAEETVPAATSAETTTVTAEETTVSATTAKTTAVTEKTTTTSRTATSASQTVTATTAVQQVQNEQQTVIVQQQVQQQVQQAEPVQQQEASQPVTEAQPVQNAATETVPEQPAEIPAPVPSVQPGEGVLTGIRIGIDPGHQRYANTAQEAVAPGSSQTKYKVTGGAVGVSTGIPEYVTVLDISLMLRDKLAAAGAEVYMTRESHDVNLSNQERARMMNECHVDLMLRVHCDSLQNAGASGTALYVSQSNAIAAQSRAYAEIMLPLICAATGAQNRGIVQNDNYTGQNWAEVPCMMIECGFLSNPQEDVLLNTPDYQQRLTDGILNGIIACFT